MPLMPRESMPPMQAGSELASSVSALVPASLLLLFGLCALLLASALTDGVAGQYVVVLPPEYSLPDILDLVRRADGGVIELGGFGNIVIAASAAPDFGQAVREAGAWFAFAAPRFLGCTVPQ